MQIKDWVKIEEAMTDKFGDEGIHLIWKAKYNLFGMKSIVNLNQRESETLTIKIREIFRNKVPKAKSEKSGKKAGTASSGKK